MTDRLEIYNQTVFSMWQFSHICPFAEGRRIDEQMDDFRLCRCFAPTKQVLRLQDIINVRLDYARGPHE